MSVCSPLTCMLVCAILAQLAHETAGAARTRHSLRPCVLEICQNVTTGGSENNRPLPELSPLRPKANEPVKRARDSSGVFLNPNSCKGFEPVPGKEEWMMTQNDLAVVGIDVAKDKVDACIRTVTERQDLPNHRIGATQFDCMAWQASCRQGGDGGQRWLRAWLGQGAAPGRSSRCELSIQSGFAASRYRLDALRKMIRSTRR